MSESHLAFWNVLGGLTQITHYDFDILSLNCKLGSRNPWRLFVNINFTGLKYLRLFFKANFWSNPYDSPADMDLLAKLQHLPNLEKFHLDQFFHRRSDPIWLMLRSMTNVLGQFKAKDWPRLQYLDLRFLNTTVADFQTFAAPHSGKLKTFHLHSGLLCAQVTQEEKVQRFYLPHWIRTVLCPRGGAAKCRHFLGQPGGWFVAEGEKGDAEEVEDFKEEDQAGGSWIGTWCSMDAISKVNTHLSSAISLWARIVETHVPKKLFKPNRDWNFFSCFEIRIGFTTRGEVCRWARAMKRKEATQDVEEQNREKGVTGTR